MTDRNRTRALNAFAAMGHISADRVYTAEQMLYEAEAGICRLEKPQGRFRRFLNSGWGAAAVSGIVALAVLAFIIHAGVNPPTTYEPPVKPAGSTIEMSDHGVNFTISTDQKHYPLGTDSFTVIITGKSKGESISTADMITGWELERLTDQGAVRVNVSPFEDVLLSGKPDKKEYATLQRELSIRSAAGGFAPGRYRLHFTEFNGDNFVSVAWCEFTVDDAENLDFTVKTRSPSYPVGTQTVSVIVSSHSPELALSRVAQWRIMSEDGEQEYTLYFNNLHEITQDSDTVKISLSISIKGLDVGKYRLCALHPNGEILSECGFTVTQDEGRVLQQFEFHYLKNPPFTLSVPDFETGEKTLTVTITATEPGIPLTDISLNWFLGKSDNAHWPFDDDLDPWSASVTEIREILPSEDTGGYAQCTVTFTFFYPPEWTPGSYYLMALEASMSSSNRVLATCNFTVMDNTDE